MLINPGSDRPQDPWDPDKLPTWIDITHFWVLLPLLALMGAVIAVSYFFGS